MRKTVYDGDIQKCDELLNNQFAIAGASDKEEEILLSIADLRFWRTKNPMYLKIKNMIWGHCSYHFREKH